MTRNVTLMTNFIDLGCYPNITEDQLKSANETLECIKTEQLNFNSDNELEFLKVLRFLRARKFNETQAMIMIRADVKWYVSGNLPCNLFHI